MCYHYLLNGVNQIHNKWSICCIRPNIAHLHLIFYFCTGQRKCGDMKKHRTFVAGLSVCKVTSSAQERELNKILKPKPSYHTWFLKKMWLFTPPKSTFVFQLHEQRRKGELEKHKGLLVNCGLSWFHGSQFYLKKTIT